jgi:hypothetical protein
MTLLPNLQANSILSASPASKERLSYDDDHVLILTRFVRNTPMISLAR